MSLKCACKAWLWASLNSTATFNLDYRLQIYRLSLKANGTYAYCATIASCMHQVLHFGIHGVVQARIKAAQCPAHSSMCAVVRMAVHHLMDDASCSQAGLACVPMLCSNFSFGGMDCLIACAHYFP